MFIHAGRSGLLLFDLDVDSLDVVPEPYRSAFAKAGFQSTRKDSDRGHYVFRLKPGEEFSNSPGGFAGFGDVRGHNGVIRACPSDHLNGGRYFWKRVGPIPPLPNTLRMLLKEAAEHELAMPDAELQKFLADDDHEEHPGRLKGVLATFERDVENGGARHKALIDAFCMAFRESRVGLYSARRAYEEIGAAFLATFATLQVWS